MDISKKQRRIPLHLHLAHIFPDTDISSPRELCPFTKTRMLKFGLAAHGDLIKSYEISS